ncbi:MAG: hypothetical protein EHM28_13080 [Spirochaetaceae bacterium]|nr:MAG: hypothetical protein EHM28_13080 [Spirochaetaceae bacterium]
MKKILFACAVMILFFSAQLAVAQTAKKSMDDNIGVVFLGIGLGFPAMEGDMGIPPLVAGFDWYIKFDPMVPISFGAVFGYAGSTYSLSNPLPPPESYDFDYSYLLIGVRAAYHFTQLIKVENLDVYAGVLLGYYIVNVDEPSGFPVALYDPSANTIGFGVFGGARYYFTDMFGAFAEVGYSFGYISVGGILRL